MPFLPRLLWLMDHCNNVRTGLVENYPFVGDGFQHSHPGGPRRSLRFYLRDEFPAQSNIALEPGLCGTDFRPRIGIILPIHPTYR